MVSRDFEKLIDYYPRPLDDSTVGGRTMLAKKTIYFSSVIGNPEAPVATQEYAQRIRVRFDDLRAHDAGRHSDRRDRRRTSRTQDV